MTLLIEFPVGASDSVLVEVEEAPASGLQPVGDPDVVGKSEKTFEQTVSALAPLSNAILNALAKLGQMPTDVSVELGLKISGKGTLILCSTAAEANFKATLKWSGTPSPPRS